MWTPESQKIDLALSQAIEGYIDTNPDTICETITNEWPEQIAVLLIEFFFKTTCGTCGGINDFIEIERQEGGSNYIDVICGCEITAQHDD